ncbi:MAG: TonB-dependent receptor [Cyclobacteriaceae bacterium]|nr:TonB-dependent receptor [Cyclobacteriaceae bacterium]
MNRKIIFTIVILAIVATSAARAQGDTTIVMQDIIIHENRIQTPFRESSRNISVITAEELRAMPVQSLPEALSFVPGVDIRQRGPLGVQADIGIRGGTFEQTLVLLNGIKLTDPQTGHHIMNVPVNFDNITRIEVLKGPGARIFGQNAFAGAVNIITEIPDERKISISGYGGRFKTGGLRLGIALPTEGFKQYVSASHDQSGGYRHNTDFVMNNIFYHAETGIGKGKLQFMGGYTDRAFGANGFYASPAFTEQYEEVKTGLLSLIYQWQSGNWKTSSRAYYRNNRDYYLFRRENPGVYTNDHTTQTMAVESDAAFTNALGITGIGFEYRREYIDGTWVRGSVESPSNLDGFSRQNAGFFLEHRMKLFNLVDITPGVYFNYNSDFGTDYFPGIDIGANILPDVRMYANAGKSYRVPTFYDQHYQSPAEQGNPNLLPESAISYEMGFRFLRDGWMAEVNYFQRNGRNLIDWIQMPVNDSSNIWQAMNIQNVTARGLELSLAYGFSSIYGEQFPLKSIHVSYNHLDQIFVDEAPGLSRYTLEFIRAQFIAGAEIQLFNKCNLNIKARIIDRIEQSTYTLIDARTNYQIKPNLGVYLEGTNLTNAFYTEVMTPMPGRWLRAGFRIDLGY